MSARMARRDAANAILCAVAFVVVFVLLSPWVNTPFDDDFSYAFTVKKFIETGHVIYNGWSAPLLITQVYWGAVWVKLFGFSFNILRLSTLPFAAGSLSLCYLLGRRIGLEVWEALFATALLGLSPLYLPLAMSFMTDVPALFFILASLNAFAQVDLRSPGVGWLIAGTIIAIVGGMDRQTVWIVPLAALPYLAYLGRGNRIFLIAATLGWMAILGTALATLKWFGAQGDVIVDESIPRALISVLGSPLTSFIPWTLEALFTMTLLALPALVPFVIEQIDQLRQRRRGIAVAVVVLATPVLLFLFKSSLFPFPWLENIVSPDGPAGRVELSGPNSQMLPASVSFVISAVSIAVTILALAAAVERVGKLSTFFASARRFFLPTDRQIVRPMLVLFAIAYCILLITRMDGTLLFDRYLLPLLPIVAILAMLQVRRLPRNSVRGRVAIAISAVLLVTFSGYGLATMQSLIALQCARMQAVRMLLDKRVEPTEIAAGFEYDSWTQLNSGGWLNRYSITNRTHRYKWRLGMDFLLHPRFRVEHDVTARTIHSDFPPVHYIAWLPPLQRTIYIDRFKDEVWPNWREGMPPPLKDWEDLPVW
jgi:hypothetical protein